MGLETIFNKETILDGNIEFDHEPLITEGIYSDTDPKNGEILHMLSPVQASQKKVLVRNDNDILQRLFVLSIK